MNEIYKNIQQIKNNGKNNEKNNGIMLLKESDIFSKLRKVRKEEKSKEENNEIYNDKEIKNNYNNNKDLSEEEDSPMPWSNNEGIKFQGRALIFWQIYKCRGFMMKRYLKRMIQDYFQSKKGNTPSEKTYLKKEKLQGKMDEERHLQNSQEDLSLGKSINNILIKKYKNII